MMRTLAMIVLVGVASGLIACGDSGSTPPTSTGSNSASQRAADDLRAAGANIKAAATEAATEVGPALTRAKEDARETIHDISQKVADQTATAPATQP
jgi:hypothetical protein